MAEEYKKQSNTISIGSNDPNIILVNNEWTFKVPDGFIYFIESGFDGGLEVGVDLSGSIKPLVLKGIKKEDEYLFNFALEQHYDLFGNYETALDCKYDNRVVDDDSGAKQIIIKDENNLFVDIMAVNTWPFGIELQIRIRGAEIKAFNFSTMAKNISRDELQIVIEAMKKIAGSICLNNPIITSKSRASSTKNGQVTKQAKTISNNLTDPNCIIDGTILKRYVGSNTDVVLPDGLTEIADNTFSGRKIRSIVVPEGVKIIGRRVFENCFELEEAILPSTLKELGGYSFVDCHKLKSITLGNNLTSIEDSLFSECFELSNIAIPKKVRSIEAFAFKNCRQFTSIVIPEGVESIGFTAFTDCVNLEYLYIPASVTGIYDNFMGDTPFGGCDKLTIHCPSGSTAEEYCKSHGIKYVVDASPKKVRKKADTLTAGKSNKDTVSDLSNTMGNLSSQIAEMQNQKLLDEDRQTLSETMEKLEKMSDDLHEGQVAMGKYSNFLEQQEAKEKAREEEKARRKSEALATGKSENDIVNMYIILTNEKKLHKLHRSSDEFCEIYEEDFAALSKNEIIKLRKDMLEEMEDESLSSYYAESFKQRSVEDRFSYSTRNLNNVSEEPDPVVRANWALENSQEWYDPSEYSEVRKLMDASLNNIKEQLNEQFKSIEEAWMKFSTAKDSLEISICDKAADGSDLNPEFSFFQLVIGDQLISVNLATKGIFKMSTTAMNCFPFYWDVTVRDIWEAAYNNKINDEREGADNSDELAGQAIKQIRLRHPDTKVYSSSSTNIRTSNTPGTAAPATSYSAAAQQKTTTVQAPTHTQYQETKPAKKEGCYIATAVYGSYDAPQVMTLRRFRDDTLRRTVFGRWFIRVYYRFSPRIAEKLKNARRINRFVRMILDKWVSRLNKKQQ